jgi:DNA polymerase II small subunit/DNA polymerase delta subunit B
VIIGIGFTFLNTPSVDAGELASVSPEMEQTQTFFTSTINKELQTLKGFEAPETKALVDDALKQMEVLEAQYEILKVDLVESGNDKRVIYAMISNFQSRIELLEQVITTIEEVKNLNNTKNEITI